VIAMTLRQLALIKRWHVQHRHQHPVEMQAWDLMLTAWVGGWMGLAAALLLHTPGGVVACLLLSLAPGGYVRLRQRLHKAGRLRCDWLASLHAAERLERRR
jgi:hypothetical protein